MRLFKKNKQINSKTKFVIIAGCAGSGKTHIGKLLARKLNYTFIDKDTVTRQYTDFILTHSGSNEGDRESDFYVQNIMPLEYDITLKLCKENLLLGNSVILTTPFIAYIRDANRFFDCINKEWLDVQKIDLKVIWINHDINLEYSRIKNRNALRDRHKLQFWIDYCDSIGHIEPDSLIKAYIFDNGLSGDLTTKIEEVSEWIIR